MCRVNDDHVRMKAQEALDAMRSKHKNETLQKNCVYMFRANEEHVRKAQEALDAMRSENAGLLQEKNELMGQKVA